MGTIGGWDCREKKMVFGFLKAGIEKIKAGMKKTAERLAAGINTAISVAIGRKLTDEDCDRLEELLIRNDFGPRLAFELVQKVRSAYLSREIRDAAEITDFLRAQLKESLFRDPPVMNMAASGPTVILVVGVNGTGKTTSIAKLAKRFKDEGRKVLLAAADTFRAAATDQLGIWADRAGVEMVGGNPGADPASIAYQALEKARARGMDIVIVDTAGRLHTKENLMKELGKIARVLKKLDPSAPHEVLLVLD
ncbi:MAG: AAA family ATPase, partial [Planctomycetota bacterium]|nr:AAA family ATPase [Planctomycetota bacterium]